MKTKTLLAFIFGLLTVSVFPQGNLFRNGIFLHHSTGGCIWGPNGSATSIPQQISLYNAAHGYTGADAVVCQETWYPQYNDNEWSTWHSIFETGSPESIATYLQNYSVIIIKSCFPSSNMTGTGQASDTLNPWDKTLYNYKWHWRHMLRVMQAHPENFFAIWTNAPLVSSATSPVEAFLSSLFCHWAKDTLAAGLDPEFGVIPQNVYVFDFFHKLVDANNYLPNNYAASSGDSHPNAAATALVAPQFVQEIFDASIAYENAGQLNTLTGMLTYFNSFSTPMNNVKVFLLDPAGTRLDSVITSQTGSYAFQDIPDGTYSLEFQCTKTPGGYAATDGLSVMKHFVGMNFLTGLNLAAGDVDGSGYLNAADALDISKRFVGMIVAFPAGDWVFENPVISLTGCGSTTLNIKALCYGDVNGSFTPTY